MDTIYYVECLIENDGRLEEYFIESILLGVFTDLEVAKEAVRNIDADRLTSWPRKMRKITKDELNPKGTDLERYIETEDGCYIWGYSIDITEVMPDTIYYHEKES